MRVLACVVSWNSAEELAGALDSLTTQVGVDLQVVVVDNASADTSRDLAASYPGVRVVANAANRGFAGAANQGVALARAAGAGALLICNPDVSLEGDYVARVVASLQAGDRRAAVQGKLLRLPAGTGLIDTTGHRAFTTRLFRNRGEGEVDRGQYDVAGEVFGVSGAVALYRLAALDDVAIAGEVFDEDLFAYWEDVDLDWRLQLRGWQAWYEPAARGWHERGGAGPRRSAFVEELNFANRFLVVAKNDDLLSLSRALPGFALTSTMKAAELALTVPSAFVRSLPRARLLARMVRKRRIVQAQALVAPRVVLQRWFEPFDYGSWVRTWWRRVRGERRRTSG